MNVSISALKSLVGNTNQGLMVFSAYLTVNGLVQGSVNTFSATSTGAPSGQRLLGRNATLMHTPHYIPSDTSNFGGWSEAALPSTDSDGNLQFSIEPAAANGPESFRIGIVFSVN